MKRLLSILLAICMLLSSSVTVLALDEGQTADEIMQEAPVPEEASCDTELEAYLASLEEFTVEPANPYTPGEVKNLLTAPDTGHAYEPESAPEETAVPSAAYVAGEVLFSRTTGGASLFGSDKTEAALASLGISGIVEVASFEAESGASDGFRLFGKSRETAWYQAEVNGDVLETVAALKELDGIEEAEPNYIYTTETYQEPSEVEKNANWSFYKAHDKSPDNGLHKGWWKHRNGEADDSPISDAENINPGYGTVVAVIDTGVDYTHNDLAANMWVNADEIPGDGIDNDNNGYIDDVYGCNVLAGGKKAGDPQDDHGHGTHVAGIVAMSANNEGAVGLAWGAKIMAIKAGQSTGSFTSADIAKAIKYAQQNGADVINMSFGGTEKSYLVEQALSSAFSDCVLVAAAGNNGRATTDAMAYGFSAIEVEDIYPAGYSFVLGVMATDSTGAMASFSNFDFIANGGSAEYELTAPGVNIYSTLPGNRYASWNGTSMAAPQVAAAAAILRSHYSDKSVYSTRFIYGQLSSATEVSTSFVDRHGFGHTYAALNIEDSCTILPKPNIKVTEVFALDNKRDGTANDGDAVIDAGETIDLGLTVRNQWGQTGSITVTADTVSSGGVENPNIEWITDSVTLAPAGTYAESNNGYVYDDSLLTNITNPLRFKVKDDTPNDYQIAVNLTVTTTNGVDTTDTAAYTAPPRSFTFRVVSGAGIRGEIRQNTTLDNEHYWIVENTVLVSEGVTLTVEPGTQLQFWSSDYEDAYGEKTMAGIINSGTLNMIGTEAQPISMFPGDEFSGYVVEIAGDGVETLEYCEIINPRLGYTGYSNSKTVDTLRHCHLVQNQDSNIVRWLSDGLVRDVSHCYDQCGLSVDYIESSIVEGMRGYNFSEGRKLNIQAHRQVLFNNCFVTFYASNGSGENSLFLRGNGGSIDRIGRKINLKGSEKVPRIRPTYDSTIYTYDGTESKYVFLESMPNRIDNDYYYTYQRPLAKALAAALNGTLLCLNDSTEEDFIFSTMRNQAEATRQEGDTLNIDRYYYIGYTYDEEQNAFVWEDKNSYVVAANKNHLRKDMPYGYLIIYSYPSFYNNSNKYIYGATNYLNLNFGHILEVPATLSDEEIKSRIDSFDYDSWLFDFYSPKTTNCAIINPVLNTNPETWATITAGNYNKDILCENFSGNYWGTENTTLINKMIVDGDDFAGTLADIREKPILTPESESLADIYPFSTAVWLEDRDGSIVSSAAPGETYEVHVTYNRDMDPDTRPSVTYGPATPYTDFAVRFDRWESPREWVGTTTVSPVMTAGTQYFKTSGGCAADDHWLVCGNDILRFKFEVNTTGVLAMLLQAQGGANKVELSWAQNDYDTLAGYNIYRSASSTGGFTKINSTVITGTTYTDTAVQPGQTYYYYFKVVNTSGTEEANVSNTASAAPIDNIKPVLTHTKVTAAKAGSPVTISATATDNIAVAAVKTFYRRTGTTAYTELSLIAGENNRYVGTIPAAAVTSDGLDYYVAVYDADGNAAYSGTAMLPNHIVVDGNPYISGIVPGAVSVAGGSTVTVLGGNFTAGLTLKVGGETIEAYSLVDEGQITFLAPAKAIGSYVVTLTNSANYVSSSSVPLSYTDASCTVQIPTEMEMTAAEEYTIPIYVSLTGTLTDFEASLDLPTDSFGSVSVEKADSSKSYYLDSSYTGGVLKVSCAASGNINPGNSALLNVKVTPKTVALEKTVALTLHDVACNGADIDNLVSGTATISPNYSLNALVLYYKDNKAVEGVSVAAAGVSAATDANGQTVLSGITRADVTVIAGKSGYVREKINANDAVEILKYTVNKATLSANQLIAGDVDGNGKVTAHDASLILQYRVELIDAFAAGSWKIVAANNSMTLTSGSNSITFTAILVGDVDGSWAVDE